MLRASAVAAFHGALALLIAASIAAQLAAQHWTLELFCHFRPHYVAGALALSAVAWLIWRRFAWPLWFCLGALAANVAAAHPYVDPLGGVVRDDPGLIKTETPGLRVLWANLRYTHNDVDATRRLLEDEGPDIVVLTEVAPRHAALLANARSRLSHQTPLPTGPWFELMLLSRDAPESVHFDRSLGELYPVLVARFCHARMRCVSVIAAHPPAPGGAGFLFSTHTRDAVLDRVAAHAEARRAAGDSLLIMGDFNATPFSPAFRRLLARSGARDAALARAADWRFVAPATWQAPFGLMLDHVLASRLGVSGRRIGADIGSDHLPLIVDVRLDREE